MTEDSKAKSCSCPLCKSKSKLLKGNTKRRYFCQQCFIEFTTDSKNRISQVFEIGKNGDLDEIKDWENYKLYE